MQGIVAALSLAVIGLATAANAADVSKASQRWQRHSNLASVHPLLSCDERRHRLSRWAAERGNLPEN
jgi:hypothetical protein